jgi:hypothetical protein
MTPVSWIGAMAIFYLMTSIYPKCLVDRYRQHLFEVRDDLFIYAAKGNIGFDHRAYANLRMMLNGAIRFADRFSFTYVASMFVLLRSIQFDDTESDKFSEDLRSSIAELPEEVQAYLQNVRKKLKTATAFLLIFKSPIALPLLLLMIPLVVVGRIFGKTKKSAMEFLIDASYWKKFDWGTWYEGKRLAGLNH